MKIKIPILLFLFLVQASHANDGHSLWLPARQANQVTVVCETNSPMLNLAKTELEQAWQGKNGATIKLSLTNNPLIKDDGFQLSSSEIQANTDAGILYGVTTFGNKENNLTIGAGSFSTLSSEVRIFIITLLAFSTSSLYDIPKVKSTLLVASAE